MLTLHGADEVRRRVGSELGVSEWQTVTQKVIDGFARVTGDHQWIHVDPKRAAKTPFGGTIAHGLLTLSLGPAMWNALVTFDGFAFGLQYGYDRVRFPAPLPVDSRIRLRSLLHAVDDVPGGIQITVVHTFEHEGHDKPVCVAEQLIRLFAG